MFSDVEARYVRALGLRDASDKEIFNQARAEEAVVMSKDDDFISLVKQMGPPPQIIWITCGNTSNQVLKNILSQTFSKVRSLLENGETIVEING